MLTYEMSMLLKIGPSHHTLSDSGITGVCKLTFSLHFLYTIQVRSPEGETDPQTWKTKIKQLSRKCSSYE